MRLIGMTGGPGMGKSSAAAIFRDRGIPVVDTDDLAREVVKPGTPGLAEVRQAFGDACLQADGALDRKALAQLIFRDPEARARIEALLHPRIRELWQEQARVWADSGVPVGIVVIPLLFETDAAAQFWKTACVACSGPTQHRRLLTRGWSSEEIRGRVAAQWPADRKMQAADWVIWTEGSQRILAAQLDMLMVYCRETNNCLH